MSRPFPSRMLLGACAALAVGCASQVRLLDETRTEPHAGWLREGATHPARSAFVRAEDPGRPALVMHLREVRAPDADGRALLVLQPGVLADRRTWRFLWPLLARRHDLLLVDPPGCGLSDRPAPDDLPPDGYSPAWLGRHTLRAVRAWQCAQGDTRPVAFLGHSLGSTALVRALAEPRTALEMPDLCARVDRLVLIAMADVGMREVAPIFEEIEGLALPKVLAGRVLGLLRARTREGVAASVHDPGRTAFHQEAVRLETLLADDERRGAAQAMLRRFRPLLPGDRPDWERIRLQQARHGALRMPILLLWGTDDDTLPPPMSQDVLRDLPTARLVWVPGSRHSPHQERPDEVARHVLAFLPEGR